MLEDGTQPLLSDDELKYLQESILKAVLLSQSLPGRSQKIIFPDLSFLQNQTNIFLIDENLAGSISIEGLTVPVRILSRQFLQQDARMKGDITYISFRPPEKMDNTVLLTIEIKIAPHNSDQQILGLGGIHIKFQKIAGQWQAVENPIFFAI